MRGRPPVSNREKIVNYAEYTAEQKYKDAFADLEARTGKIKHLHFRDALREYLEKHNVEFFVNAEREEIARREAAVTEMQAQIRLRNEENAGRAEATLRKILSDQMYIGARVTAGYREQLAADVARRYQLNPDDMLELCENIFIEFSERYGKNYRRIKEI